MNRYREIIQFCSITSSSLSTSLALSTVTQCQCQVCIIAGAVLSISDKTLLCMLSQPLFRKAGSIAYLTAWKFYCSLGTSHSFLKNEIGHIKLQKGYVCFAEWKASTTLLPLTFQCSHIPGVAAGLLSNKSNLSWQQQIINMIL